MLTATVKIPTSSMDKLKRIIERKAMQVLEDVSLKTYNYILTHDYPYYSGAYISSWTISVDTPEKVSHEAHRAGEYTAPNVQMALNIQNPYQPVYISNYADHSFKVEYLGTPTHPKEGWYVASEARWNTIGSYRFF